MIKSVKRESGKGEVVHSVSGFMHKVRHTHADSQHTCRYLTLLFIIRLQWIERGKVNDQLREKEGKKVTKQHLTCKEKRKKRSRKCVSVRARLTGALTSTIIFPRVLLRSRWSARFCFCCSTRSRVVRYSSANSLRILLNLCTLISLML